jgi:DNA-binding GntR family transcriptional regulator
MPRTPSSRTEGAAGASATGSTGLEPDAEGRVHRAIVEAVLGHRLPPGTRLVEAPLCAAFGINRSLLRRVFVRLASEKVIELHHNRGATVAEPGRDEMRQVFEARQLLEGGVLRALEARADSLETGRLRALVADEKAAYEAGHWSAWVRLSGEFHLQLAGLLGNSEVDTMLRSLVARTTLMKALYHSHTASVCSFDEHARILDAMQAGDLDRSCRLMHAHLHEAQGKLQQTQSPENVDLLALFKPGA